MTQIETIKQHLTDLKAGRNTREQALADHLEIDIEDVEPASYGDNTFEASGGEYMVLTDGEADQVASDYIKESVWAFNPGFIIDHSSRLDYDQKDVLKGIQEQCEGSNGIILALIDNIEEFIEDAISSDGRGHFMSTYDGEENEEGEYFIYRTN